MTENYISLEREIEEIDRIDDWSKKVKAMKKIKDKIKFEQKKLVELTSAFSREDVIKEELMYKTFGVNVCKNENEKIELNKLVSSFEEAKLLEDKIKIFNIMNKEIKSIETQLFANEN